MSDKPIVSCINVGSMKCGSRSIFAMLSQNKDFLLPALDNNNVSFNSYSRKETHYFMREIEDKKHYENFFYNVNGIHGEGVSAYIASIEYLKKIKRYNPDIKILYFVRDPLKRIWSQYNFYMKNISFLNKNKNLKYFIENKQILESKKYELQKDHYYDLKRLIYFSMYGTHITQIYNIFPKENVFLIKLEDLNENYQIIINELEVFLGLQPNPNIEYVHRIKTAQIRNKEELEDAKDLIQELLKDEMISFYEKTGIDYRFEG